MTDQRPKRDTMSMEAAKISNMREIAAIVEVLERKGYNLARHDTCESRAADQRTC